MLISEMSFCELFTFFRERKNITKASVARHIGKTDGYIRKLENYDYTPPVYDICISLAELFELSHDEKQFFLKQAFLGRIKDEKQFYNDLNREVELVADYQKIDNDIQRTHAIYRRENKISKCTYLISWEAKSNKLFLNEQIKEELAALILEVVSEFECYYHSVKINDGKVQLAIDLSPSSNLQDFIKGVKSFTSGALKNKFSELSSFYTVWKDGYAVFTINGLSNIDTQYIDLNSLESEVDKVSTKKCPQKT